MLKPIKDPFSDVFNDSLELNGITFFTEISTSLIASMGREKGAISGQYLEGQKTKHLSDLYKDMEDLIVKALAQACPEISEGGLTWQMGVSNASIEPIMLSLFPVMDGVKESLHIGELFKVAEQIDEKQANRIIGEPGDAILVCHYGTDEGKVNEGGYESGQATDYTAIGMDLNISSPIGIL